MEKWLEFHHCLFHKVDAFINEILELNLGLVIQSCLASSPDLEFIVFSFFLGFCVSVGC